MNKKLRHKIYGDSISEWIKKVPNELEVDAIGLWQIVPVGREEFGLKGDDLIEYVSCNLKALFEKGAKPVQGRLENGCSNWYLTNIYGVTPEEIINTIINQWQALEEKGEGDDYCWGVWFALPKFCKK